MKLTISTLQMVMLPFRLLRYRRRIELTSDGYHSSTHNHTNFGIADESNGRIIESDVELGPHD